MDRCGAADSCPQPVSPIDRTVDQLIRQLIEDDPAHPTRIRTVRGVGYSFEP